MRLALIAVIPLLVACGQAPKPPAADTTAAAAPAPPPPPAPVNLATLAGTWIQQTRPENRDTVVTSELDIQVSTEGWTQTLTGQKPQPARVRVDADSIMVEVGPFPSVLRKGAKVTTNTVYRVQDGKLVGTLVAHYTGAGADSVMRARVEATRK
jgi:hypothetical protein